MCFNEKNGNGQEKVLLTLEERLRLAARSRASSQEAAAALVRKLAGTYVGLFLHGKVDFDLLYDLMGEFLEAPGVDLESYRGFCPAFRMAIEQDNDLFRQAQHPEEFDPCAPMWGVRVNNALILLGLMLLDHAMDRQNGRPVFYCTRMTLGQYLDVLAEISFKPERKETELFCYWRSNFLKSYDSEQPLAKTLTIILRRYMAAWKTFDYLNHVLRCMDGLACCLEQMGSENEKELRRFRQCLQRYGAGGEQQEQPWGIRLGDPVGYFLELARHYSCSLPDPGGDIKAKTLRSQIFLPKRNYETDLLRPLVEGVPFPEFQPLLNQHLSIGRLGGAMEELNRTVADLEMLWVEPYLWMTGGEEETECTKI